MSTYLKTTLSAKGLPKNERSAYIILRLSLGAACASLLLLAATGCQTEQASPGASGAMFAETLTNASPKSDVLVLREGDTVRISFPGAPSLNTVQQIRRDGRITLPLIGEFKAAGLTPPDMEKELLTQYGPQLQTKEVSVSVDSSAFPIYVTGAVIRPGRILPDRPLTVLQAIIEAGGFDYTRADLKKVRVIRNENGQTQHYTLNLKAVLQGGQPEQFKLKPSDIIYVPERFTWF